jgi:excisionase family DNA binding protein
MNVVTHAEHELPELLTVEQLAAYLHVPVTTIYAWRGRKKGPPAVRYGKRLVFRADDVRNWLEQQNTR